MSTLKTIRKRVNFLFTTVEISWTTSIPSLVPDHLRLQESSPSQSVDTKQNTEAQRFVRFSLNWLDVDHQCCCLKDHIPPDTQQTNKHVYRSPVNGSGWKAHFYLPRDTTLRAGNTTNKGCWHYNDARKENLGFGNWNKRTKKFNSLID